MANLQVTIEQQSRKDFICDKYFSLESNICDVVALQKALSQIMHRDDLSELKYELLDAIEKLLIDIKQLYYASETAGVKKVA